MSPNNDIAAAFDMRVRTPRDLGLVIRDRRRALGLDQRTLARKVGVSRQWLVEAEKGKPRAEIGLVLRTLAAIELEVTIEPTLLQLSGSAGSGAGAAASSPIDAIVDRAKQPKS